MLYTADKIGFIILLLLLFWTMLRNGVLTFLHDVILTKFSLSFFFVFDTAAVNWITLYSTLLSLHRVQVLRQCNAV